MSKKVTVTTLDPSKEVGYTSFSNEHNVPQYFDKDGKRIAWIEKEVDYKPEYDSETSEIKHWYYKNETEVFRDVHEKIVTFRSRSFIGRVVKQLTVVFADKYLLRFFT